MKIPFLGLIVTFVFCVFMGITAISMGVGALVPSINQIAAPVVCPGGELTPGSQRFNPYPGKTGHLDQLGVRRPEIREARAGEPAPHRPHRGERPGGRAVRPDWILDAARRKPSPLKESLTTAGHGRSDRDEPA